MRNCPNCNNGVENDALQCPHCGATTNFHSDNKIKKNIKIEKDKKQHTTNFPIVFIIIILVILIYFKSTTKTTMNTANSQVSANLHKCLYNLPPKSADEDFESQFEYYNSCKAGFKELEGTLTNDEKNHLFDETIPANLSKDQTYRNALFALKQLFFRGAAAAGIISSQGDRARALAILNDIESILNPYRQIAPSKLYAILDKLKIQFGNPYIDNMVPQP